jgi:hypothetical protein
MKGLAITQCNDAQILAKFIDYSPMADSAVRLYIPAYRVKDGFLAPFEPNVGSLLQHAERSRPFASSYANPVSWSKMRPP